MNQKLLVLSLVFTLTGFVFAQNALASTPVLDGYINEAMQSNLSLRQKQFSLQQSISALNQAMGLFLPSVNIEARYSRAGGGRVIEFPVGDMMNPVYQTLNEILTGMGQQPKPFPTLQNEMIPFLREKEHDTKLRVIQPVFQPKIYYNYKIKSGLKKIQEYDVQIYKRRLKTDVKKAYYSYLKLVEVVELLEQTKELLQENLRVSQKLYENQKITKDGVLRSKAELSGLEQKRITALNNKNLAISYFNFLLNKPLDSNIQIMKGLSVSAQIQIQPDLSQAAIERREELKQLKMAMELSGYQKDIKTSDFLPDLNLVGDFGYQGETYKFDSDHDYWMVSGLMQWNLFRGFSDQAGRQQVEIEKQKLRLQMKELKQQIQLQIQKAVSNYQSAGLMVISATEEQGSAVESFRMVEKQYEAGAVPLIAFLDAQNSMTSAGMNQIIAVYDLLIKKAELEYVSCIEGF